MAYLARQNLPSSIPPRPPAAAYPWTPPLSGCDTWLARKLRWIEQELGLCTPGSSQEQELRESRYYYVTLAFRLIARPRCESGFPQHRRSLASRAFDRTAVFGFLSQVRTWLNGSVRTGPPEAIKKKVSGVRFP